jgi:hypothetical protein
LARAGLSRGAATQHCGANPYDISTRRVSRKVNDAMLRAVLKLMANDGLILSEMGVLSRVRYSLHIALKLILL